MLAASSELKQERAPNIDAATLMQIYLVGAGGVGKTTLLNAFINGVEHHHNIIHKIDEVARPLMRDLGINQSDLHANNLFWDLQTKIARRQLDEERKAEVASNPSRTIISDRSVIDALVYAMQRFPYGFPPSSTGKIVSSTQLDTEAGLFDGLSLLVGGREAAEEVVGRYRSALIVLVNPFDDNDATDDKVRLVMNNTELTAFTEKCRDVLSLLKIDYLDLKEKALLVRLKMLCEAVEEQGLAIAGKEHDKSN